MSFFKDFKEDFSQAVNELMPGENMEKEEFDDDADILVNTLESELDVESELSKLDGLLEKVTKDVKEPKSTIPAEPVIDETTAEPVIDEKPIEQATPGEIPEVAKVAELIKEEPMKEEQKETSAPAVPAIEEGKETMMNEEPVFTQLNQMAAEPKAVEEDKIMNDLNNEIDIETKKAAEMPLPGKEVSDEVAVITEGTCIRGNMESTGSLDIRGKIEGNVTCNGKLVVTGIITGNSTSSEFFADAAKIEGEVVSTGTVKVGLGSVIIGNITATSAVIAGAIKGDIDVQGPVVVDTSAVVMGNIKSRSVQINNGAVIEGFCSQCYADIDVESLFGEKKVK